jgi:hypothetical protein
MEPNEQQITILSHFFVFENQTSETAALEIESTSCGCTTCKIEKNRVLPKQTSKIEISYDLSYARQNRSETVLIKTNLSYPKYISYKLVADCYPKIDILQEEGEIFCPPGKSVNVPILCRSYSLLDEKKREITLSAIGNFQNLKKDINIADKEQSQLGIRKNDQHYILSLNCPLPQESTFKNGEYDVLLTLKKDNMLLEKKMTWKAKQYIYPYPQKLFFNCINEKDLKADIILNCDIPFHVLSATTKNSSCQVILPENNNLKQQDIHVITINDRIKSENTQDILIITTDHPQQPYVCVPITFLVSIPSSSYPKQ